METQTLTIPATDGFALEASLFEHEPDAPAPTTVVIAPATAVKRQYYEKFASFLAGRQLRALTFDYRGIGGSRREAIRRHPGTMRDWGEKDLAGVLDFARRRHPGARVVVVGHSAGGQLVGLTDRNRFVAALLAVGAQSGYWGHWSLPRRYAMMGVWYGLIPALTRVFSYFPAKRLGQGEDLPPGVALEWARWCRAPRFFVDASGQPIPGCFAGFRGPIRAYSFADDAFAPRQAVDALMTFYRDATIERRHVRPAELSVRHVGHFGFFRERFRDSLWTESTAWLAGA